jgi:hypothetical protein
VRDDEWAFVAPYLTLLPEDAGQRRHHLRVVFNALRYLMLSKSTTTTHLSQCRHGSCDCLVVHRSALPVQLCGGSLHAREGRRHVDRIGSMLERELGDNTNWSD